MPTLPIADATDLAAELTELIPQTSVALPSAAVFSNLDQFDPAFADHHRQVVYPARLATPSSIRLVRWPKDTLVIPREGYPTIANNALVKEQVAPWFADSPERLDAIISAKAEVERIDAECLLLARFGEGTWGHWLGELLPRAVLAEHACPQRFMYAVPASTTTPGQIGLASSVLQSLRAYGIEDNRLLRLLPDRNYVFRSLSTVTSVRSDNVMHPGALDLMRTTVSFSSQALDSYLPARLAILREDVTRRNIANAREVKTILANCGFSFSEVGKIAFGAQVALFAGATSVFSVLGSGLSGLIYSPNHVKVIAPAPGAWGDSFFYPLVQLRAGKFADIRGPIEEENRTLMRDSSFLVPLESLKEALNLLELR